MSTEFDTSVHSNVFEMPEIQDFLTKFTNAFAKEAINFYEYWGILPFTDSEKQVNSVVVPAIHSVTKNVWLEQPYKWEKEQKFLDIATVDGDNIYLIELKHSWSNKDAKSKKEWETAIEQISKLKESTVKQFANYEDYTIYKMALMVLVTEITNDLDHDVLKFSSQEFAENLFKKYQNDQKQAYQSNYVATWKLEDHQKYLHEFDKGEQIFPFISFVVRIEKIFD